MGENPESKQMAAFVRKMCKTHDISGLMEIEFLKTEGQTYILEVNPRLSGILNCLTMDGIAPYMERLIVPYLAHYGLEIRAKDYDTTEDLFFPALGTITQT